MQKKSFVNLHQPHFVPILVGVLAFLAVSVSLAASTDAPVIPASGAGILIPFAIAYLSRRRAIGGWLFFFYLQLYLSFLANLIFFPQILTNINPRQWDDSFLHAMFFLSVVPILVTIIVELFAATMLLFRRTERNVKVLRNTLIALVVTSAAAVFIDFAYFADDPAIIFDVLTLVLAVIWSLYFSLARRVRLVFIENNWVYTSFIERRKLRSSTLEPKPASGLKAVSEGLWRLTLILTIVLPILFLFGALLLDEAGILDADDEVVIPLVIFVFVAPYICVKAWLWVRKGYHLDRERCD